MPGPRNILVIRPEKLGDLVVTTPVFRALKHSFPGAAITVLTDEVYGEILQDDPHVNQVISVHWRWRWRGQHEPISSIAGKIRMVGSFDLALVLYSNWWGWNAVCALAGIRRVVQIGGTWLGVVLGHKMIRRNAYSRHLHYRDYYLEAAAAIGAALPESDDRNPRLFLCTQELEAFCARFPKPPNSKRVILHPFGHGSSPNYSAQSYVQLALQLASIQNVQVWLTGGKADLAIWPGIEHPNVYSQWMGSLSLRELMAACASADVVVCGSTGVIHLAAALGTPTVGLFCPHPGSQPLAWGPLGSRTVNLVVPERLCRKLGDSNSFCTANQSCDLICGIQLESVIRAVQDIFDHRTS